jgi:hypothetical protein
LGRSTCIRHAPALYQGRSTAALHALEHVPPVRDGDVDAAFGPLPQLARFGNAAKLGYIIAVRLTGAVLGNVLVGRARPSPDYAAGERPWHVTAVQDRECRRRDHDGRGFAADDPPVRVAVPALRARG